MITFNKVLFKFFLLFFVSISIGADKGIDHYNSNEFEKARQYYESVIMDRNNDPAANFGLGSTAFQQQDYIAAMKGFETALGTDNNELKSSAYYNMANILAQNQRLEESLAFFRKSLELDPSDLDAKINYELIKFQLQQQQQNQDQNQDQDENNKDDEQTGDQKKQDQQQDKEQQEQNEQNDFSDEEESEQQSNQNEDQREDQSQQQKQDMAENEKQESQDKQNAAAILDALKKDEKINKKHQMSLTKKRKLEKDW